MIIVFIIEMINQYDKYMTGSYGYDYSTTTE